MNAMEAAQAAADRFPNSAKHQYQLFSAVLQAEKLGRLAGDYELADQLHERAQSMLRGGFAEMERAQAAVDEFPQDDTRRFRLFQAISTAARLEELDGQVRVRSHQGEELSQRALSHLFAMKAAPEIQGVDISGHPLTLSSYRGKVVMLDFFSNRCYASRAMYPLERRLVKEYAGRPFVLLGVNIDDQNPQVLQELTRQNELMWRCWAAGKEISETWRIPVCPTIVLIDQEGAVRRQLTGAPSTPSEEQEYTRAVEALVLEAERGKPKAIALDTAAGADAEIVTKQLQRPLVLVPRGARWKYLDDGSVPDTAWRSLDFDDRHWKEGEAELGFGDGDERTLVGFGADTTKKFAATFFRHRFEVSEEASTQSLCLSFVADDGAVVYMNGQEVSRDNVPTEAGQQGEFSTNDLGDNVLFEHEVSSPTPRGGPNVLAVVVHQRSPDSSDLSFDLSRTCRHPQPATVLRLSELIGNGPQFVPLRAFIKEAKLILSTADSMPDVELAHVVDGRTVHEIAVPKQPSQTAGSDEFDVTESLRAWVAGKPNEGWAIIAQDGTAATDDGPRNTLHARLTVQYWPSPVPSAKSPR